MEPYFRARYRLMARDSDRGKPSSTMVGTAPAGFRARNSGSRLLQRRIIELQRYMGIVQVQLGGHP
jgi:hypothetical protein